MRARRSRQVGMIGELVEPDVFHVRADAANRSVSQPGKRGALGNHPLGVVIGNDLVAIRDDRDLLRHAADHGARQFSPFFSTIAGLLIHEFPEGRNVLGEIPEHQIGAVAAQIQLARLVLGKRQRPDRMVVGIKQGPVGVSAVFIGIAEQKFA